MESVFESWRWRTWYDVCFLWRKKKAASVVCHEVTILAVVTVSLCGFM